MEDTEFLAVFDDTGNRVGVKSREGVHRDHDWHWLVFVWCAWLDPAGNPVTLLQVRARPGDPYLGHVDALAAGHVNATESHLQGARREFLEEVGIDVDPGDLFYLESRPLENPNGQCRRVVQHFYLCKRPVTLEEVSFNDEVSGFVEMKVEDLVALLDGDVSTACGQGRFADRADFPASVEVTGDSFSAYSAAIVDNFRRSMRRILDLPDLQARST